MTKAALIAVTPLRLECPDCGKAMDTAFPPYVVFTYPCGHHYRLPLQNLSEAIKALSREGLIEEWNPMLETFIKRYINRPEQADPNARK
jgi:hypothetical protein